MEAQCSSRPHQCGTVFTVAISGATCSGKTTVVERLSQQLKHVITIHQDDFYKERECVPKSPEGILNWDTPEALDAEKLREQVRRVTRDPHLFCPLCTSSPDYNAPAYARHLLFIEGTMILSLREVRALCHLCFFVTIDFDLCQQRRGTKSYNTNPEEIPDPPAYFDRCVWPAYLAQLQALQQDSTIGEQAFLDGSRPIEELATSIWSVVSSSRNRTS